MKAKIKDDKVKWGIIGVGDVCEVKSAPAMQLIHDSDVHAVMRRNSLKAKDYAERHGVKKWYDNASALINDPEVNAIYIATPPNAHAAYTVQAAKAGKPVYVEKPMAMNFEECQNMVTACKEANVPLYVAYYRRRLPNFEKIKSLIDDGLIGEVRMVNIELYKTLTPDILKNITDDMPVNWRIDPAISGGGYFFDLAAHQLDYLDYIFGPIKEIFGSAANQGAQYRAADIIQGSFTFENGIKGFGSWCFTVHESAVKDEMTIIGSQGKISLSFFGAPKVFLNIGDSSQTAVFEFEMPKHIQQPLIQTIIDDLLGKGSCPSSGESAKRTNWVMEELTKNYYNKNI